MRSSLSKGKGELEGDSDELEELPELYGLFGNEKECEAGRQPPRQVLLPRVV
jgi:hypothetical protein